MKPFYFAVMFAFALAQTPAVVQAAGVSAYIPLNLEPEMERQIERVLILADEPVLKRPFPVALVELALPAACKKDQALCAKVKKYLERYSRDYALTHASVTGTAAHGGAADVVPNNHGLPMDSKWEVSAQGFVQPNDYMLASAGVIAYDGRARPTGSMLSLGFNWAQLDIGYRDHWFSPATDSTMMIGTEAPTMPSVTLSNYEPLTRLGFQYEFFWAQMAPSDHILGGGQSTTAESRGNPKLFGAQFSIEPFSGWSLGVNRQLQYGGGGLPDSARFLARDFFKPGGQSQTQGNQEASYVSRFIFPGKTPFAVYFQYAGEDTLDGGSYLLGNSALTAGIDFPVLWRYFDMTYEVSEWQNSWYVNSVFLDGMTNYRLVTGQWGADQRVFNDGVGARSQMLRIGWAPSFGGYLEEQVRYLVNQGYGIFPYRHFSEFTLRYSRPWNELTVGGEADAGHDVFGKSFVRLSGFVRYGGDQNTHTRDADDDDDSSASTDTHGGELFVDAGVNVNQVKANLQQGFPIVTSRVGTGPHIGFGARRAVSETNDLGVRLEDDQVDGHNLFGVRALDYRHRFGNSFALGFFAGVARYDLATPAYSLYAGVGAQWRNVLPKWDIGADFRYAQNVARDHLLASDAPIAGVRPDSFYKIETGLLYISRHF
ncbi:MAG TPA: capsule assembly Wzi family protein [Steroidobacteraceae bacterium]|nr:capsule assembly Wzi family protein [Steroidobacteraceae bacterium]